MALLPQPGALVSFIDVVDDIIFYLLDQTFAALVNIYPLDGSQKCTLDVLPQVVRNLRTPVVLPSADQFQLRPKDGQKNLLPAGVLALLVGLEDRPQDLVFPEILSAPFVHETKHLAPRREVMEEGVVHLEALEKGLVLWPREFPFEASALEASALEAFPEVIL